MSKQNRAVESQQEKLKQQKNRSAIVTKQADGQVPVTELPGRPMTAVGDSPTQVQATGLSDRRFYTAQRQAMATQIGRVGGNQHLQRVIARVKEHGQRESDIGPLNDPYEQEADRVADRVMSMAPTIAPDVQLQDEKSEEKSKIQTQSLAASITPLVQRDGLSKAVQDTPSAPPATLQSPPSLESRLDKNKGSGSPLPGDVRSFMESRFGTDFSQVRVHTGSESVQMNRELDAQAFTHKQDIYFGNGKSPARDVLTAHELTHVVQQSGSAPLTGDEVAHRSPGRFVPAVQGAVVQRDKSKSESKKTSFDRAAIETIKTNAERRHESITTFIRESRGTLQIYKSRLLAAATLYKAAFSRHKAVLDEAKEAAADRKQMISTIAGFAVGVTLGVPGAVARLGLKTLAERAVKAFAVGGELTELAVGAGAAWVSGGPDAKAFEPTAEIPELKELAVWRTLAEMSDKLLGISLLTAKQMKIVSAAGTALTEIRLREGGAKNLEKTDAELQALVNALKSADEASGEVTLGLQDAKAEIDELGATPARYMSVDEVEQDIWIEWIADLTDDDLLDEDDITDHLEDLGVIGKGRKVWDEESGGWRRQPPRLDVDFGSWVSDEDEEDAVNAARAKLGRHTPTSSGEYYYDEE